MSPQLQNFISSAFVGLMPKIGSGDWRKVKRARRVVCGRMQATVYDAASYGVWMANTDCARASKCKREARRHG